MRALDETDNLKLGPSSCLRAASHWVGSDSTELRQRGLACADEAKEDLQTSRCRSMWIVSFPSAVDGMLIDFTARSASQTEQAVSMTSVEADQTCLRLS